MFTGYRCPYIRIVAAPDPTAVEIRPASTVVLVRDGETGVEVLMVRRNRDAAFLGGAHVFPGGAIDEVDHSDLARSAVRWSGDDGEFSWRAAAVRELAEEANVCVGPDLDPAGHEGADLYEHVVAAGVRLDADALEYISNWVTPIGQSRRFDTRFYVVADTGRVVTDDREVFDAVWIRPEDALDRSESGEWFLEFPTRMTLGAFVGHPDSASFVAQARAMPVRRIAPRIGVGSDGSQVILLEGDPGFDEAPA
jgi:8-oxo-dGTP pyrophosphatase MutT (NUDIX family)